MVCIEITASTGKTTIPNAKIADSAPKLFLVRTEIIIHFK